MILPIYAYGQPVLKKVAEEITPDYPNLKELIDNMWDTMYDAHGVGLAAPQIGASIRLFLIDSEQIEKDDDPQHVGFKRVFINAHKVEELQALLGEKFQLQTLKEIGCFDEIPETADTFEGNSLQKAMYVWERFQIDCIADDSGLEVDSLNGEPGIFSARYAGEHGNHEKNMAKLLKNLEGIENRTAQFRCVITLIINGLTYNFEGIIRGKIIHQIIS